MAANPQDHSPPPPSDPTRAAAREHALYPEDQAVARLLHQLELTGGARHRAVSLGVALVEGARARRDERPFLDAFLQEFGLSNQEGIALMCIAEALLRIPDDATADRLIAEQLADRGLVGACGQIRIPVRQCLDLGSDADRRDSGSRSLDQGGRRRLDAQAHAQGGRAAGAPRGTARDAHHRRRVRGRAHRSRRRWSAARASRRWHCAPSTCWARARAPSGMPTGILRSYEHAIDVIGAAAAPAAPRTKRSSISIKLSALEPRYSLTAAHARHAPAGPEDARTRTPRGGLRYSAHHRCGGGGPPGPVPGCDRGTCARFAHPRLARARPRGAGVLQARARTVIDWVAAPSRDRPGGA